jgi:hypothetical protein
VFGVTKYKHVFAIMDTKLVVERVFPKELGEHVSAVVSQQLHLSQRLSDLFWVGQGTTSGSVLRRREL